MTAPVVPSGFLRDYSQLHRGDGDDARYVFISETDFSLYTHAIVAPVVVWSGPGAFFEDEIPPETREALARYFDGETSAIDALDVDPGGTEFQAAVWRALREIPAGETRTYGELAGAVGHSGSARAAGGAVGSNPIAIVIPCHRVVGADGRLTGFGGGVRRKRWLLTHEGASLAPVAEPLALF